MPVTMNLSCRVERVPIVCGGCQQPFAVGDEVRVAARSRMDNGTLVITPVLHCADCAFDAADGPPIYTGVFGPETAGHLG